MVKLAVYFYYHGLLDEKEVFFQESVVLHLSVNNTSIQNVECRETGRVTLGTF